MNIFDLRNGIDQDDLELGLRVACALYVENQTSPNNFLQILDFKYKWEIDKKKNGVYLPSVIENDQLERH